MTPTRLPTGLDGLDGRLGGGVAAGALVALTAPPDSGSERLCYALAAANDARYLSTFRPADEVRAVLDAHPGEVSVEQTPADALLESPGETLDGLDLDGSAVVVDTATELERAGRDQYRRALDVLKRRLRATGSVALLHCQDVEPAPMRRGLTLGRADVTLRLRFTGFPERLDPRLYVTKHRGGPSPDEAIPLAFAGRGVEVR
ncbi:MAG: transcriptional regulator [Haloarculaceae archaeon]